jgi:hypothetical protein
MKKELLLIIFVLAVSTKGVMAQQLTVNAGPDTVICYLSQTMPHIGNLNAASGGTPPYSYEWQYGSSNWVNTALTDPTKPYTQMVQFDHQVDSMILTLKVTDAANNVATDQVTVYKSTFTYIMADCRKFKFPQDTVEMFGAARSDWGPTKYEWAPAEYMSYIPGKELITWTPVTKTYTSTVTDRFGCIAGGGDCIITVYPVGIDDVKADNNIIVYPNPATSQSVLQVNEQLIGGTLKIVAVDGKEVYRSKLNNTKTTIGNFLQSASTYFYTVEKGGKTVALGKLVVE